MLDVLFFAIHSARREGEICRLEWNDNDAKARTGLVRDAKHPTAKEGNHRRFKYTPEAWAIVERQPKTSEYIFPYESKSICDAFTRACHVLGIENLRFHDMRHEATSRLFERGYQIHEVAQFTLHESWNELKRYTNLRPEKVRELPEAVETNAEFPRKKRRSSTRGAVNQPSVAVDQSGPQDRPLSSAVTSSGGLSLDRYCSHARQRILVMQSTEYCFGMHGTKVVESMPRLMQRHRQILGRIGDARPQSRMWAPAIVMCHP